MKLTIQDKKENALLQRTEITADLVFDAATPSGTQVRDALASTLGCEAPLVVVKGIDTKFGTTTAKVEAYQYENKDVRNALEPKVAKIEAEEAKKAAEEAKKKAEEEKAAAEAKAAEEKAQEPKEE